MSQRKSRLAARQMRGPIGSTAALMRDANKFQPESHAYQQDVLYSSLDSTQLIATVRLTCGHRALLFSKDGARFTQQTLPRVLVCEHCAAAEKKESRVHTNRHQNPPHQLHNLIANGGKVIVVGGRNKTWNSYRDHPQLEFWSGDDAAETGRIIRNHNNNLPPNTHALLISKFISHSQLDTVMADARRKRIIMFANLTDNEMYNKLDKIIGPKAPPVPTPAPITTPPPVSAPVPSVLRKAQRGEVKGLVEQQDDAALRPIESAKILLTLATDQGFRTTLASLQTMVTTHRRASGIHARPSRTAPAPVPIPPVPVTPPGALSEVLRIFDDAIAGLQLTRDTLAQQAALAAENSELRKVVDQMKAFLGKA